MNSTEVSENIKKSGDQGKNCSADPKWAAIVDDQLIPMPRRHVSAAVLYEQAQVPDTQVILRDHNSPNDPVIPLDATVDLASGNVFYVAPACDIKAAGACTGPAKLGYIVDDRWEVVIPPEQTGHTIRDLFALPPDVDLLRDYESPVDQLITDTDSAIFSEGPVMRTRKRHEGLFIIVNKRRFAEVNGVKHEMTGREIAVLVFPDPEQTDVFKVEGTAEAPIRLDQSVHIKCGNEFKVIRKNVIAGFEEPRIRREIALLQAGGGQVSFLPAPDGAVIYHAVQVRKGQPVETTDVLVRIPSGYPAAFLDCAYLPQGSPLLGRVPGAAQQTEAIAGQQWTRVSVHPYQGNGSAWDKDRHGFHTYYDEVLSWLGK